MSVAVSMQNFVDKYGAFAAGAAKGSGVFPETILTAAALESSYGTSQLSAKYNNFFGIKADSSWKGKRVILQTREQSTTGYEIVTSAAFRVYDSPGESFMNYVHFISGQRYVKAGVLAATSPVQQFERIKAAGYATDTKYVAKLTSIYQSVKSWAFSNPVVLSGSMIAVFVCVAVFIFSIKKSKMYV